jgi:hypothetical protein
MSTSLRVLMGFWISILDNQLNSETRKEIWCENHNNREQLTHGWLGERGKTRLQDK